MTRAVYRFREFRIEPDTGAEAEPVTFAVRCTACGAGSPAAASTDEAVAWIPAHLREWPHHVGYREHITRPYRAVAGDWL